MSRALPLLLALVALALPASAAAQAACPGADDAPTPGAPAAARTATLCLLNAERRAHGLHALRPNGRLRRAALAYSRAMVTGGFFDHVSPVDRSTPAGRIRAAGYLRGADGWRIGENLAWGTGSLATPARIVDGWMHSLDHRHNILTPGFRRIGIGVAPGAPVRVAGATRGATYTTDFGARG